MANPIKYSGTIEGGSIKSGNYLLGVGGGSYYPTSTTGWWSTKGREPVTNGYTIFSFKGAGYADQGPSIVQASNDSELNGWILSYGGAVAGVTAGSTASAALSWVISQPDILAINRVYENIVSNGLMFLVDSAFVPSYPKGLTTYYDMGSRGANSTAFNNQVTWVGASATPSLIGTFQFDGTGDFISFGSFASFGSPPNLFPLSNFTMDAWVRYTGSTPAQNKFIFSFGIGPRINMNTSGQYQLQVQSSLGSQTIQTTATYIDTNWHHVVATVTSSSTIAIYVDGATGATAASTAWDGTSSSGNQTISIGCNPATPAQGWLGNIGPVKLYNTALSYEEVLQNYTAQYSRYYP